MPRGKSTQRAVFHVLQWCFIAVLSAGSFACTAFPTVISTPSPTQLPECPPPSYSANIYNPTPIPALTPLPPTPYNANAQGQFNLTPKQTAFQNLEREVERWTNMVTIDAGGASQARITITFLSPELLRAVSILDMLDENPGNPYIYSESARLLSEIAKREKLIFFLTVHAVKNTSEPSATPHTLEIIADQLFLTNVDGLPIAPAYYDHDLDQPLTLPEQYASGYIYYPLAVTSTKGCVEALNSTFDTKIVLKLPSLTIDKVKSGPYTWTIQYKYLLNTGGTASGNSQWQIPLDTEIRPSDIPPDNSETTGEFWLHYTKFLWSKLTPKH